MRREARARVVEQLGRLTTLPDVDRTVLPEVVAHSERLIRALEDSEDTRLSAYSSFLPPRLVTACRDASLIPFFGSGVSISAGIPSWAGLLERLGLPTDYISDPQVEHDALTQAELIAHEIGADSIQQRILELTNDVTHPTLAHHLLAELRLPVYITTNYDSLFESAWLSRWKTEPIVVTTDADVAALGLDRSTKFPLGDAKTGWRPVVIKMHGDAGSEIPQLILTRSDYRRHYRANSKLFELIKDLMRSSVVFFLGFSHRDPEVSRLVDDMVFRFESGYYDTTPRPLFSLQFDMRQRTPEVFAARGIVALRPPTMLTSLAPDAIRSASVSVELIELLIATTDNSHSKIDLEPQLRAAVKAIVDDVEEAMHILADGKDEVLAALSDSTTLTPILERLLAKLGSRAGQGVYATFDNGDVAGRVLPAGLKLDSREVGSFAPRPYFRQAQMFRHEFVSDVFNSIYNDQATVFFCMPLGTATHFAGLLFCAAQPGAWPTIVKTRDSALPYDFVIVDSNGVTIVPSLREFVPRDPQKLPAGESPFSNQGFVFAKAHELSRRDVHVAHVVQNVVPIGFDDDVHDVSADLRLYSMVAAIRGTRWKLALSKVVPAAVPRPKPGSKKP